MSAASRRGRLIVFEGGEASGKSTQARRLARRIGAHLSFEPGATPVGKRIRRIVLGTDTLHLDPRAEALLIAADRAQHVAEVLEPRLAEGTDVVSDRYIGSSLAYQGFGRGLGVDEVRQMSTWATGGLLPDAVVLLEVSAETAAARLKGERDRMEREERSFHERVRYGFTRLAETEQHWVVVDANADRKTVDARVDRALNRLLGL
jgi:dTMP kinase